VLTSTLLALLLFSPASQDEVTRGQSIYRSNCAFCHGLTGLGGRGPNLVSHPPPDADIKRIVKNGVPGTTMPAFGDFDDEDLSALVTFVKHLAGSAPAGEKITGDPARGKQTYAKLGCANCHQIGTEGSTYGPELTRIGGARPVHYLEESITAPSVDVPPEYQGVLVTTADGRKVQGVRVNLGKDAKDVVESKTSLMPPYKLPKPELDDLVAYLTTLRAEAAQGQAKKAEGIR
jgi:cytochrome c oxidase cbb3-type subunit 3